MANIASARKRSRQANKLNQHNASRRSLLRTRIKKVVAAIARQDVEAAQELYRSAASMIDRMRNKGLLHRNKAARLNARLCARIRALSLTKNDAPTP